MAGRILIADRAIGGRRQDRPVPNYERPDRNFVAQRRIAREIKSVSNVLLVGSQRLRAGTERWCGQIAICRQVPALSLS